MGDGVHVCVAEKGDEAAAVGMFKLILVFPIKCDPSATFFVVINCQTEIYERQ